MSDDPNESRLGLLKKKVNLSNSDLYELAYNHQKFMATVRKFNNQAKNKIDFEMPQEALVFLSEAERVLEYAASCGKNIDRNLIICVLHNEACCFQKSWDLDKCSNYLEALIYNFQCTSDSVQTSPRSQDQPYKDESQQSEQMQLSMLMRKPWSHRLQLCKYELQFCAINSQLRNHNIALVSGRKSIQLIKSTFKELQKIGQEYYLPLDQKGSISGTGLDEPFQEFQTKMKIIQGICSIDDVPDVNRLEEYLITTKYYLSKWNIRKLESKNQSLKDSLRNFSIGSVMQLKPLSFEQNKESTIDIEKWLQNAYQERSQTEIFKSESYEKILNKVLLLSMGYFTIATQMRLISNEKYRKSEQIKKESREYRQSQIYHLISLIVSCIYVPYDMLYMRHILASFNNHYPTSIDSSFAASTEGKVLKKKFDSMRLADDRELKKDNTTLLSNCDFEKSIRISTHDLQEVKERTKKIVLKSGEKHLKKSLPSKKVKSRLSSSKNSKSGKNAPNQSGSGPKAQKKRAQTIKSNASSLRIESKANSKINSQLQDMGGSSGNEYFECRRKAKGAKGKSKQKRREKSREKVTAQLLKKNIDRYYF